MGAILCNRLTLDKKAWVWWHLGTYNIEIIFGDAPLNNHFDFVRISALLSVNALAMSTIYNDADDMQTRSTEPSTFMASNQHSNAQQTDRTRRLIPYMAFYIPKLNREYLPLTDRYQTNYKQMVNITNGISIFLFAKAFVIW